MLYVSQGKFNVMNGHISSVHGLNSNKANVQTDGNILGRHTYTTLENSAVRLYFLDQTGYKYHVSPK